MTVDDNGDRKAHTQAVKNLISNCIFRENRTIKKRCFYF